MQDLGEVRRHRVLVLADDLRQRRCVGRGRQRRRHADLVREDAPAVQHLDLRMLHALQDGRQLCVVIKR